MQNNNKSVYQERDKLDICLLILVLYIYDNDEECSMGLYMYAGALSRNKKWWCQFLSGIFSSISLTVKYLRKRAPIQSGRCLMAYTAITFSRVLGETMWPPPDLQYCSASSQDSFKSGLNDVQLSL